MSMSTFAPFVATPQPSALDATKHVNYTLGMVLGVDDLNQEFAYLLGHQHWLTRDAIGYGTLTGLQVSLTSDAARGPGIQVSAGIALSPRGQLIRVSPSQAATLNDWISAHAADVQTRIATQPTNPARGTLTLFVVLSYRECPTDPVLIPGQPCRTEDQATVPSRRADDFALELRFDAPEQREDVAVGRLVAWLARIPIGDAAGSTLDQFLSALRSAASAPSSPPGGFLPGPPPASLRIQTNDVPRFLRAAFRVWVTELRPAWRSAGVGPGQRTPEASNPNAVADADSVLLAQLTLQLVRPSLTGPPTNWQVDPAGVTVDDSQRPIVLSLRLVQEWLLAGVAARPSASSPPGGGGGGGGPITLAGDVTGASTATRVAGLSGVPVQTTGMRDGDVLAFVAADNVWRPRPLPVGGPIGSPPGGGGPGGVSATLVAAGIIAVDSTSGWVAGGLWARIVRDGQVFVSFDGYRDPTGPTNYLVKALPIYSLASVSGSAARTPVVTFDHFDFANHGFILLITDGSQPLSQAALRSMQLMIEVTLLTGLTART